MNFRDEREMTYDEAEEVFQAMSAMDHLFQLNKIEENVQISATASFLLTYFVESKEKKDFENFIHFLIHSYMKSYRKKNPLAEKEQNEQ